MLSESVKAFWSNYVMGIMLEKLKVLPWNSTWPLTQEWILALVRRSRTPGNVLSTETQRMATWSGRISARVSLCVRTRATAPRALLSTLFYFIAYLASKYNIDTVVTPLCIASNKILIRAHRCYQRDLFRRVPGHWRPSDSLRAKRDAKSALNMLQIVMLPVIRARELVKCSIYRIFSLSLSQKDYNPCWSKLLLPVYKLVSNWWKRSNRTVVDKRGASEPPRPPCV